MQSGGVLVAGACGWELCLNYRFHRLAPGSLQCQLLTTSPRMKPIHKSAKLNNVLYDVRGPIVDAAKQMEDEGQKIIKLNIGNLAPLPR